VALARNRRLVSPKSCSYIAVRSESSWP
jgi:hypothetical protein